MTNAEIFRAAAARIRRDGWCRQAAGDIYDEHGGPVCLGGALMYAAPEADPFALVPSRRGAAVNAVWARVGNIPYWNDKIAQTKEEVLAVLDGLVFDEDLKAAAQSPLPAAFDKAIPVAEQIPQPVEA